MKNYVSFFFGILFTLSYLLLLNFTTKSSNVELAPPNTLSSHQLSSGVGALEYNGRTVGMFYVPDYPKGACTYEEHWYVSKDYVHPGSRNPVSMTLTPIPTLKYQSVDNFKMKMKEVFPDGHYIKVVAYEEIPGCPNL